MILERQNVDKIVETFVKNISKLILKCNIEYKGDELIKFIKVCSSLKSSIRWNFNFEKLYNKLLKIPQIPFEVLWNLHIFQILPLEIYLHKLNSPQCILKFSERFCIFCFQDFSNRGSGFSAQTGLMSNIIVKAFTCSNENISEIKELREVSMTVVENLLRYIFAFKDGDISTKRFEAFFSLWTCGIMDIDTLHLFSKFALQNFINTSKVTAIEAFLVLNNWKKLADPFHLVNIIDKFMKSLRQDEMRSTLMQSLWNEDTNWKNFSVIIAALSQSTQSLLVTEIIALLLKNGFELLNPRSLIKALVIGRLVTLINGATSYGLWFQTNVGNGLQRRNPQAVSLLIQALSDLLPYEENIDCIKTMLEKPLNVPPECRSMNLDYIVLLRTRLKDLQPKVDTEKIIQKVLCYFQETKKIPPYILEASLMNKHHYLNEFLPLLLKPRVIPSVTDTREKFIDFLSKSGRIPNYIYKKYKMSCHEEQQNLIAGINMDDGFLDEDDDIQIID